MLDRYSGKNSKTSSIIIPFFLIAIVVFTVFSKSLSYGFLWLDDLQVINRESILENSRDLKADFTSSRLKDQTERSYYRPLFKIVHTLNYIFAGESAFGFRLVSILIHILNIFIFYLILLKFNFIKYRALICAIFYGALPINVSAVVLISARADILAAFFVLLSFLSYLKFFKSDKRFHLLTSLLFYIFAVLSKESALPFFILIIIYSIAAAKFRKQVLYYTTVPLAYLFLRVGILGRLGTGVPFLQGDGYVAVLSSLAAFFKYISKFFIPTNLSLSDAFLKYRTFLNFEVISGATLLLGLGYYLVFCFKNKNTVLTFALSWLILFYIPISNIIPALHFWAERFFYLPGFGLAAFIGYFTMRRNILNLIMPVFTAFYVIVNMNYQGYFKNNEVLFKRALAVSDFSQEAYTMLGYSYLLSGNYPFSIYYYHLATQDYDNYYTFSSPVESYNNLGVLFLRLNQAQEARKWLDILVKSGKANDAAYSNMDILDSLENLNRQPAGELKE